ncbi:hypothetical protein Tco_0866915 [Tanacetum coccineum]
MLMWLLHTNMHQDLSNHPKEILSLFKNVLTWNSNNVHSSLTSKLGCKVTWWRTLKGWKNSKKLFISKEKMNERMTEMLNLLNEYTKGIAPKEVLVRAEISKLVIRYVNFISPIKEEDEVEHDDLVNIDVVERNSVLGYEEVVEGEEAKKNELNKDNKNVNTVWGDYQNETVGHDYHGTKSLVTLNDLYMIR